MSDVIEVKESDVQGTVLSLTTIHRAIDPGFPEPTAIASVKMDVGPVAIAFAAAGLTIGARVLLSAKQDENRPVLFATRL